VCVLAAPTQINYDGANIPAGLSRAGFETWAGNHVDLVICDFPYKGPSPASVPCGPGGTVISGPTGSTGGLSPATPASVKAQAVQIAKQDYSDYSTLFLSPSDSLMIYSGLWLELEAVIGFIVGLGLASLLGQRTVAVILMIVLEVILTPLLSTASIAHMINFQRSVVGLAVAHLEPSGLPLLFLGGGGHAGGGGGPGGQGGPQLVPESTAVAICVIVAWLVGWTILGAWRMMTRDA
jgi:uncharacterized membrane protein SirB2